MYLCFRSLIVIAAALALGACGGGTPAQPGSTSTPAPSTAAATAPPTDADFGTAECDNYVKLYLACVDRMPAAAQGQARDALEKTRTSWKQAAATEQGRAALAMTCKAATDASAPAMRAYGCSW